MSEVKYEKPKMRVVDIRSREKMASDFGILAVCWGDHDGGTKVWYFDYSGTGYITFTMTNCSGKYTIGDYSTIPSDELGVAMEELEDFVGLHSFDDKYFNPDTPGVGWS